MESNITKEFYKLVAEFGSELVEEMKSNLQKNGSIASGSLYDSLTYDIRQEADKLVLEFSSEDYAQFVEDGRAPGKYPPISKIKEWTRYKGIPESAAFPIARSIYLFGIEPKPFIKPALDSKMKDFMDKIAKIYVKNIPLDIKGILK